MTSVGTPWQNLALSGTPMRREFRVLNATVTVAAGIVLYALDSEGYYHLLLPVTTDTLVPPDRRSAGVHILPLVLEEEHTKAYFIDVACRKLTLNEVFTHLADDILSVLGSDASDPVATCRRVLARWRELIEREAASRLSREALAGLFAELYQLRRLMERNPESLSRWAGPLGGRHDFEAGQTALEVKASLRRDGRFFEVHGVEQLAPPYLGALFVAAMKLEIGDAGGESVPKVIQDIMDRGADSRDFLAKLGAAGYDPADVRYEELRFRIKEERVYRVHEDFPRITVESFANGRIPSGVIRMQYTIDLSAEPPFPVDPAEVAQVYERLTSLPT